MQTDDQSCIDGIQIGSQVFRCTPQDSASARDREIYTPTFRLYHEYMAWLTAILTQNTAGRPPAATSSPEAFHLSYFLSCFENLLRKSLHGTLEDGISKSLRIKVRHGSNPVRADGGDSIHHCVQPCFALYYSLFISPCRWGMAHIHLYEGEGSATSCIITMSSLPAKGFQLKGII